MVPSPLPRQQECSRPDAAPGRFGFALLGAIMPGVARGHRPSLPYDPGIDVGAVRHRAGGEDTVVPVDAVACARQFPATDIVSQFLRRRLSAGPRLSLRVDACLPPFGASIPSKRMRAPEISRLSPSRTRARPINGEAGAAVQCW